MNRQIDTEAKAMLWLGSLKEAVVFYTNKYGEPPNYVFCRPEHKLFSGKAWKNLEVQQRDGQTHRLKIRQDETGPYTPLVVLCRTKQEWLKP